MALDAARSVILDRLEERLRLAPEMAPSAFARVVSDACRRLPNLGRSGGLARLDRLIAAGAWTDAALVLVELELPAWSLKRACREGGEWFCSLSRQPNLPAALDATADARHHSLPLAILLAFVEARRMTESAATPVLTTPRVRPALEGMICCDNFA